MSARDVAVINAIAGCLPLLTLCPELECGCVTGDGCVVNQTAAHELLDALTGAGLVVTAAQLNRPKET